MCPHFQSAEVPATATATAGTEAAAGAGFRQEVALAEGSVAHRGLR